MHDDRSWMRLLASVAIASLVAGCSAAPSGSSSTAPASRGPTPVPTPETLTDYPGGFPTSYVNAADPANPGLTPVPGGLRGQSTGKLRAGDGTRGTYTSTWVENRVSAAEVMCGGVTYKNLVTGETPEVTTEVDVPDWGHAELVTVGHVVVYRSSRNGSSPAVCDESSGGTFQFEFTRGPIKQLMSGSWHWDEDGRLVFDPPALPSSSPLQSPG